jgi:hydrogenase maturation protein HypF
MSERANNRGMVRRRVKIAGVVQGVGFRPYLYCLAEELHLGGEVANGTGGVVVEIEGECAQVEEFLRRLPIETPPLAQVESIAVEAIGTRGERGFRIIASDATGHVTTQIPADAATCMDCLREMSDPTNRRYEYPFINCTHCGPRFTITRSIPYDRPQTSMARFTMCSACQAEYDDPRDRRFHAQPNACWACGPRLTLLGADGIPIAGTEPLPVALELLRAGKIVALKGIGGFHLVVDATNAAAVTRLRERKHRFGKPLAVMVRDVQQARELCQVSDPEAALLISKERPIVLLRGLPFHGLAAEVAPGVPWLGVLLPYAPLHHLLLKDDRLRALVMTSANLSEEPIAIANDEAVTRLRGIADAFLVHDREILQRADDSVMQVMERRPQFLRRSRGHVPLPVELPQDAPPILAVGGHLKSVFTLASGRHAYQSQHLGDLESLPSLEFFAEALQHFENIFQVSPEYIVHDLHPGYLSTAWALKQPQPKVAVQHHHAHIAGCMAEHGLCGPVIGLALDGTGYGSDGHVWGGEVSIATLTSLERFAHLKYVAMPGSEAAVRQPWRMAFAHLYAAIGERVFDSELLARLKVSEHDARLLARLIERGVNSPLTSSCGRMFDAAAALILGRDRVDYEAQAALELEGVAETAWEDFESGYEVSFEGDAPLVLNPSRLWNELLEDLHRGVAQDTVSTRFHLGIANAYVRAAIAASGQTGIRAVCLSGGVFHNRLLTEIVRQRLHEAGMETYLPWRTCPGDGGLSYGQVAVAAALISNATAS